MASRPRPGTKDGAGQFLAHRHRPDDDGRRRLPFHQPRRPAAPATSPDPARNTSTCSTSATGAERATVTSMLPAGPLTSWETTMATASTRFLSDGDVSRRRRDGRLFVISRRYYTRSTLTAWNFRDSSDRAALEIRQRRLSAAEYTGRGPRPEHRRHRRRQRARDHLRRVTVDHNGAGKCSTGSRSATRRTSATSTPRRAGLGLSVPHAGSSTSGSTVAASTNPGDHAFIRPGPLGRRRHRPRRRRRRVPGNAAGNLGVGGVVMSASSGTTVRAATPRRSTSSSGRPRRRRELEDGTAITKNKVAEDARRAARSARRTTDRQRHGLTARSDPGLAEIIWRRVKRSALASTPPPT